MKIQWIRLNNFFLTATVTSYRLAVRISKKHVSALQMAAAGADAFFVTMLGTYTPVHNALVTAYDNWLAQNGTQQSQTLSVEQLLRLLSGTKAENWMVAVKPLYGKTSIRFKQLFPALKKPFQAGSQQDRIDAVKAFSISIGSDAGLTALKTDVDAFYLLLNNAHTAQKGSITNTGNLSETVELARVAMCTAQLADYGGLLQKYASHPETAGNFFDEAALRNGAQVLFNHQVGKGKVNLVTKHSAAPGDKYSLENTSDVDLLFGYVLHKTDQPSTVSVLVPAQENIIVVASDLTNDLANNHYLVCYNASAVAVGEFTVEFL
jgi:hypothetical protein